MKTAEQRISKYTSKFDPEVVRGRFSAVKDLSVSQEQARQSELAKINSDVRGILDANGVPSLLAALYQSFALRVYGLTRRFTGNTLTAEVKGSKYTWMQRGAVESILDEIIRYFGISPPTVP